MTAVPAGVQRLRLAAVCSLLTAAVFLQEPGRVVTDTKLDLTVDPWGWLQRALHLWEPHGWLGGVQNQAYGYLFPMGPFFGVGQSVGLPPWVVQRLWASLLVCAAVVGVVRLTKALGIGTPTSALAAGVLYALSPRFLTTLGPLSAETLPMALAPWMVLPLVCGAVAGRARPAAARSGVAILCAGAVNAVATLAVLPLPALYLLTRQRGPARRRLLAWWVVAVVAATAWWLVPLVLLGHLSPPFLDWIESARVTTLPTNLVETLRGTSDWVAFSADTNGPAWRGGWLLVTEPTFVLDTVLIAGLGLAGIAHRGVPERRWLVTCTLVGVVAVTFGHLGPLDGPFAATAHSLLDGALAPFRNVHKFDPVLRLPLVLGSAHGLALLGRRIRTVQAPALVPLTAGLACVVLAGAASPLLTGQLAPAGAYQAIPGYWREVAGYLDEHDDGAALVVPGSSFGTYIWGTPRDEPLQPLAATPWAVRDAVPLAPAGNVRLLDAIERRLADGQGGPGLSALLGQAGIRYVVVRNDLDYGEAQAPRPIVVHEALDESPGLEPVAGFGPPVGGGSVPGLRADANLDLVRRAVEVYRVDDAAPRVEAVPLSDARRVSGGPESVADLADAGVLAPVEVFDGDLVAVPSLQEWGLSDRVLTDGYRRREVDFGRVHDQASAVLADDDALALNNPARDYLPYPDTVGTSGRWLGARVDASSSLSDAGTPGGTRPDQQPFAAVDQDTSTSWSSAATHGAVGQWLQVTVPAGTTAASLRLVVLPDATGVWANRVAVTTDQGTVTAPVDEPGEPVEVPLPAGATTRFRVEALAVSNGGQGQSFVVAEVSVPGVTISRPFALPSPSGGAGVFVLTADSGRAACAEAGARALCAEGLARAAERSDLDRTLPGEQGSWSLAGSAVGRPGSALDALLDRQVRGIRARASSRAVDDPRGRPQLAVDGDLTTGWVAATGDHTPTLTVTLPEARRVRGFVVELDPALAASAPLSVRVRTPDGELRQGVVGPDNRVVFARPVRAASFDVTFPDIRPEGTVDAYTRRLDLLPVGLSELVPLGAEDLVQTLPSNELVHSACGVGPTVEIDGRVWQTAVSGTRGAVERLDPVPLAVCGDARTALAAPSNAVLAQPSQTWLPRILTLTKTPQTTLARDSGVATTLVVDSVDRRLVDVAARASETLLMVRENVSPGWRARADGQPLTSVTVDGWHQGYLLPAGPATQVELVYEPQRGYAAGLAVGAVLAVLLLAAAVRRPRESAPPSAWSAAPAARIDAAILLIGLVWVGGAAGGVATVVGLLTVHAVDRRPRLAWVIPTWTAGLLLVAGAAFVRDPWAGTGTYAGSLAWPQAVALLALGLALAQLTGRGAAGAGPGVPPGSS